MEALKQVAVITSIFCWTNFFCNNNRFSGFCTTGERNILMPPSTTGQITKGDIMKGEIKGGNITKGTVQNETVTGADIKGVI